MKKIKKIMYDNMYRIELNGFAIVGLVTLILYGGVKLIIESINIFQ